VATLRLDPKLLYSVELAARQQRRTVSSYLEWAAQQSLDRIRLTDSTGSWPRSMADEIEQLWDADEIERFVKLASRHPELLKHDEQMVWDRIKDDPYVWPRRGGEQLVANLNTGRLRAHWDRLVLGAASGGTGGSLLKNT
jgi:hypothetical protein